MYIKVSALLPGLLTGPEPWVSQGQVLKIIIIVQTSIIY